MAYYGKGDADYLFQILFNIRCDFSNKKKLRIEKKLAIIVCKELIEQTGGDKKLNRLLEVIKKYKTNYDGRYFRAEFPEGYEGLREYFDRQSKLTHQHEDKGE